VLEVLAPREPLRLEVEAAFPFGCGFGMSGASALAAAYAVDRLLGLGLPHPELGMLAHHAEVANATGLGDVGGQFNGGVMIKRRPYDYLSVEQLPVHPETLHVRIFGPILTAEVINSREKLLHINAAGRAAMQEITKAGESLTLPGLLDISLEFAKHSRLLVSERLREAIESARREGHAASMIMLGEAVVSSGPFPGSRPVKIYYGADGEQPGD
jgi:pantoate kinase